MFLIWFTYVLTLHANQLAFLTSFGFHLFCFTGLEEFGSFKESSLPLSTLSFSTIETCFDRGMKPLLAFATSSIGDDDVTNAFQKSSESSESKKDLSTKLEVEAMESSSGGSLSSSLPSPTWIIYDGRKKDHNKNHRQCQSLWN